MYPLGLGCTTLPFDWLWFSLTVSVCCKERMRTAPISEGLEPGTSKKTGHVKFVSESLGCFTQCDPL